MAELESALEQKFQMLVRRRGGTAIKLAPTVKGTPDRLVLTSDGMMYLVELKTETGKLSPRQLLWHEEASKRGIKVHTLFGLERIKHWVDAYV